jgi:hypothetical protein
MSMYQVRLALPKNCDATDATNWHVVQEQPNGRFAEHNNLNTYSADHYAQVHDRDVRELLVTLKKDRDILASYLTPGALTEFQQGRKHSLEFAQKFESNSELFEKLMKCLDVAAASYAGEHSLSCGDDLRNTNEMMRIHTLLKTRLC